MSTPPWTVGASPARPAPCAWVSPAAWSTWTRSCGSSSSGPGSSPVTPVRRKVRSTASRRPGRPPSTPSDKRQRSSVTLRFGTDGVRGVANAELTPELVLALGRAAARVIGGPRFLIGRDTRLSGPLLQAALSAGLATEGADVGDLGVLPP